MLQAYHIGDMPRHRSPTLLQRSSFALTIGAALGSIIALATVYLFTL